MTTDAKIRNAKPGVKPYKIPCEKGLFALIKPNGSKLWRFKYRHDGKEKLLSLGMYPDVSLKEACERRDEARRLREQGIDPSENRKAQKSAQAERSANSTVGAALNRKEKSAKNGFSNGYFQIRLFSRIQGCSVLLAKARNYAVRLGVSRLMMEPQRHKGTKKKSFLSVFVPS
uniref:Integrase DNA-binding domain-containing protein n=1 Tax=Candidatus Kentrum sp. FM TaxID=2126340 RepID=A0A450WLR2_9GAMM|nr:MAG: protein of unknown function (DUF4102) [Candidatus Kentron sp. FM]